MGSCVKLHKKLSFADPVFITPGRYKLPLLTMPPPRTFRNNKSALEERFFVEDAIHSLLDLNCIEELAESPGIINPLSVSKQKSGKKRLILDLRHINRHRRERSS